MQFTNVQIIPHRLTFKFAAGTSRGVYTDHQVYYVRLDANGRMGVGEIAPLRGLSIDATDALAGKLQEVVNVLRQIAVPKSADEVAEVVDSLQLGSFPSIQFGVETALYDWYYGGKRTIVKNDFSLGRQAININGLVWMGDPAFMEKQLHDLVQRGFACIKMKVGALDFDTECAILQALRERYGKELEVRVDANGAFQPDEAPEKLRRLAKYDIHSIEQPIAAGHWQKMHQICKDSPIPVVLDEELIGVASPDKVALLEAIQPHYVVFKPTLLGGIAQTREWIRLCDERAIPWWITSALESNIGLNAICQLAADYPLTMPQGLGTGSLYTNNVPSPLTIERDCIMIHPEKSWDLSVLSQ